MHLWAHPGRRTLPYSVRSVSPFRRLKVDGAQPLFLGFQRSCLCRAAGYGVELRPFDEPVEVRAGRENR